MLNLNRLIEYVFFFGLIGLIGYLLWLMFTPFITALSLAAVIVTICYPIYGRVLSLTPWRNESLAALISTIIVLVIVIIPIFWISALLIGEATSLYRILGNGDHSLADVLYDFEELVGTIIPGLQLDMNSHLRQGAEWATGNLGAIFAGTASTVFSFFIAIIGCFYFFRDGRRFTKSLIIISPLADKDDSLILKRMSSAVRGVALGTVLVAIIQGVSSAIGFSLFGFDRAVLFGVIVALFGLVPGIGPSVVFLPAAGYLAFTGDYFGAIGLVVWFFVAVSLIDNILGPYLMSRAHPMHPFLVLLSVIGGIIMLGPIGFVVGPVITSVFIVLLEIYAQHIAPNNKPGDV
ncbi:MAG: AI-2E family transporter [Candidatus Paceibacterota bacterium]